jgi:hypothetical protein
MVVTAAVICWELLGIADFIACLGHSIKMGRRIYFSLSFYLPKARARIGSSNFMGSEDRALAFARREPLLAAPFQSPIPAH